MYSRTSRLQRTGKCPRRLLGSRPTRDARSTPPEENSKRATPRDPCSWQGCLAGEVCRHPNARKEARDLWGRAAASAGGARAKPTDSAQGKEKPPCRTIQAADSDAARERLVAHHKHSYIPPPAWSSAARIAQHSPSSLLQPFPSLFPSYLPRRQSPAPGTPATISQLLESYGFVTRGIPVSCADRAGRLL
jgi:hypothetical protein